MGRVPKAALGNIPFRFFETTAGIYDSQLDKHHILPLTGYEADNSWRKYSLSCWNLINTLSSSDTRPLRVSIHPRDLELLLEQSLRRMLKTITRNIHYRQLAQPKKKREVNEHFPFWFPALSVGSD